MQTQIANMFVILGRCAAPVVLFSKSQIHAYLENPGDFSEIYGFLKKNTKMQESQTSSAARADMV